MPSLEMSRVRSWLIAYNRLHRISQWDLICIRQSDGGHLHTPPDTRAEKVSRDTTSIAFASIGKSGVRGYDTTYAQCYCYGSSIRGRRRARCWRSWDLFNQLLCTAELNPDLFDQTA